VLVIAGITWIRPLTCGDQPGKIARSLSGGVPERSKGSDCKSDGSAFVGSNPTPSTSMGLPRGGRQDRTALTGAHCHRAGIVQW
jgi:hypothetical protein